MADPIQMQHSDFKAQHSASQQKSPPLLALGIWICEISRLHRGIQENSNVRARNPEANCLPPVRQL